MRICLRFDYPTENFVTLKTPARSFDASVTTESAATLRIAVSITLLMAAGASTQAAEPETRTMSTVSVAATALDSPEPYAGDQFARGGQLGLLGDRDFMETPYSVTAFTEEFLREQQAASIKDILRFDPAVTFQGPSSSSSDSFLIRGFYTDVSEIRLNGLKGLAGDYTLQTDAFERVEVLKGPAAALGGGVGSLGGQINVRGKRATDNPLTRITLRGVSDGIFGGNLDVGRRFGDDGAFGARGNLTYTDGDTEIDNENRRNELASAGLDYRGERFRASVDLLAQRREETGAQGMNFTRDPDTQFVPDPPDVRSGVNTQLDPNQSPINYRARTQALSYAARAGYDILSNLTAEIAFGQLSGSYRDTFPYPNGEPVEDTVTFDLFQSMFRNSVESGEALIRGDWTTGPVRHEASLAYTRFRSYFRYGNVVTTGFATVPAGEPFDQRLGYGDVPLDLFTTSTEESLAIADTMSMADDRLFIIAALRNQSVEDEQHEVPSGDYAQPASTYRESAWTPTLGMVFRPQEYLSLYANYIQGLESGTRVPAEYGMTEDNQVIRYENAGDVFPPYKTKQYEAGVKIDLGKLGGTLAAYQIAQPNILNVPTSDPLLYRMELNGETRNRGVELSVFGEPLAGLRLIASGAVIDATLQKTEGGLLDGNTAEGQPRYGYTLNVDYDLPWLSGLALQGTVTGKSRQYTNVENTQELRAWAVADLGVRYRSPSWHNLEFQLVASNIFDEQYWATSERGYLGYGDPRTIRMSVAVDL